jgi:uncharacterized membrane protein YwzB
MAGSLSIGSAASSARVFQCPNCKETIDTAAQQCRFCSAAVDPRAAELAADFMARVNQACSDASFVKILGGMELSFWLLSYVPLVGIVGHWGFLFLLVAVPVMAIRWWARFQAIQTDDADFIRAKRTVMRVGITVLLVLLFALSSIVLLMSGKYTPE